MRMKENKPIVDIMLDLETLGNQHNPVITRIGMVTFSLDEGIAETEYFDYLVKPTSCSDVGLNCRSMSGTDTTMDFWLKQPIHVIQESVLNSFENGDQIKLVLSDISAWINNLRESGKDIRIYGNGPTADIIWLRSAYMACGMKIPWNFWEEVCVRTYKDIGRRLLGVDLNIPFEEVKHNPVDDCIFQIRQILAVRAKIAELELKINGKD